MNILDQIVLTKRGELLELKKFKNLERIKREVFEMQRKYSPRDFAGTFADHDSIKLIAEIKLASPSHGRLTELSHIDLAKIYADSPADAISVLTEKKYFHGKLEFVKEVKKIASQPVLRKDFILDEYQIYETFLAEADAFLLIASVLTKKQLVDFINIGKSLKLSALVEVHNEHELTKAVECKADIIGINNRDLMTMKIDLATTERLARLIPNNIIIISESGINSGADVRHLKSTGVRGILVGSSIVKESDPLKKIMELKL